MRTIRYSITMMVVLLCVLFAGIWYIYSTDIPYAYYYPYIIFTLLFIAVMVITGELVVDDPSTRTQRWTNHFIMGLSFLLAAIWVGWTASKAIRYVFFSPPGYKVLPTSPFLPYTGTMPTYLLSPELRAQTEMRNDLLSANRGISASQARMGDRYALGNGVKKDDTYAFRWYRLAAQNGDIRSQLVTGDLYRRGIGVGMNKREAVRWFKEAARNNSPEAYYQLATMMYFGEYKSPSMERVVEYVERAENGGSVAARSFLSSFYYNGIVVEKDYGKAMRLAEASLSDATITSHMVLGMGQLFGFGVPRDASKAVENLTKAATKGNTTAKVLLSYCYMHGEGVEKNPARALSLVKEALDSDGEANTLLGGYHELGYGVEQSYAKAEEYYRKAIALGSDNGKVQLARMYYYGLGLTQDRNTAKQLIMEAANANNIYGQLYATIFFDEKFNNDSLNEAVQLLEFSFDATQGAEIAHILAQAYAEGIGVKPDAKKAQLYEEAAGDFPNSVRQS